MPAPYGLNSSTNPWRCVLQAPGSSVGQTGDWMIVATQNCKVIGNNKCQSWRNAAEMAAAGTCGNYDGTPSDPTGANSWLKKGGDLMDPRVISLFIIPYQALLTPIFFMFVQLKLHNSIFGLAIIHTAIQMPFSVYIMRNSFESVPKEIAEAAEMDGANSFQTLWRIYLPAIRPAIVTVALFAFITSWNELLGALVIMSKGDAFTLPVILTAARQQTILGGTDWGMLQAGILISIIPCVLFYLLLQRYYVSGLLSGAVK